MEIALLNDDAMWPRDEGRIRDGVQTSLFHFTGPYFYRRVIRGEERRNRQTIMTKGLQMYSTENVTDEASATDTRRRRRK